MKKLLADRIIAHYAGARERYLELMADPARSTGSSRPARSGSARWPRRRWPRSASRWACADDRCSTPRVRTRATGASVERDADPRRRSRSSSSSSASSPLVLLLRRHPADVLPRLAARVHHQPDRHPDRRRRSRACRGCWRPSSSTRGRGRDAGRRSSSWPPAPWRPRSRSSSTSIPDIKRDLPDDPRAVAGLARTRSGSARSTWSPRPRRSSATSTRSRRRCVAPLQQIAVASLSVVGTMLIVFFLSIYMVIDRDADPGLPVPARAAGLRRGGAPARRRRSRARSAGSCAARH